MFHLSSSLTDLSLQIFLKTTFLGLMLAQMEGRESAVSERQEEVSELSTNIFNRHHETVRPSSTERPCRDWTHQHRNHQQANTHGVLVGVHQCVHTVSPVSTEHCDTLTLSLSQHSRVTGSCWSWRSTSRTCVLSSCLCSRANGCMCTTVGLRSGLLCWN